MCLGRVRRRHARGLEFRTGHLQESPAGVRPPPRGRSYRDGSRATPHRINSFGFRLAILIAALVTLAGGVGAATANPALKVVRFHGYRVTVPATWPVINLSADPSACVRFDRHAVYLGTPGAREACPGTAIGRAEAILIEPAPRAAAARRAVLAQAPVSGTAFLVPSAGVIVVATWAGHPSVIARAVGHAVRASVPAGAPRLGVANIALRGASINAGNAPTTTLGFDTCAAPSLAAMNAWASSPYRTVGVYLGGVNSACAQPNLTAAWVGAVTGAGWRLIPTYVGYQGVGACGGGCASITASKATAEGIAAANDAATKAAALDLPPGNPIYDDMEQYSRGGANTTAVMAFLSAWTTQLHVDGYTSGVYSSASSGISDLVAAVGTGMVEPDELWIADWNNLHSASDPYVPAGDWADHQRLHQYEGGHDETYGGTTLDIDNDYIDGATAGSTGFPPPDGSFVSYQGKAYRLAGGAPLYVSSWAAVGGSHASLALTSLQWRELHPYPTDGTLVQSASSGAIYEISGGSPLYVSNLAALGSARPVVRIDQWDLSHLASPLAHMLAAPANGAFVTVAQTGRSYRIAGDAPIPVTSWSVFGGVQPSTLIDAWDVLHPANPSSRLRARPRNGTRVRAVAAGAYWVFESGYRSPATAAPGAVAVDDGGLAVFPVAPPCTVPRLLHLSLTQAETALARAFCGLGTVHRPVFIARGHVLRVTRQSAAAATRHATGYPVGLTLA